jgi:site-specific DNA-methyltransferase (adenine-specific)
MPTTKRKKPTTKRPPKAAPAQASTSTKLAVDLVPDQANVRTRDERAKATIRASLKQFKPARSIVIDGDDIVRAGNGTLEEYVASGGTDVLIVDPAPGQLVAVRRRDWTPSEAVGYSVADNRASELASWDDQGLATILDSLRGDESLDLAAVGFDDGEIDRLIAGLGDDILGGSSGGGGTSGAPEPQIDRATELQEKWKTKRGQIWEIPSDTTEGVSHRLLCGDSTNAEDVRKLLSDEKIGCVATDPPYSSGSLHAGGRRQSTNSKYKQTESKRDYLEFSGDNKDQRSFISWCSLWIAMIREFCDPECYLFVFSDWRQVPAVTDAIQFGGWIWRGTNVWDKGEGARMAHQGYFRAQAEFIVWGTPAALTPKFEAGEGSHPGVMLCTVDSDKVHLTQKPAAVIEWLISISTGLIYDPFAGSGTTIVAAEQTGRSCRAIEIEPRYCAVILERLSGMGLEPRLVD